MSHDYITFHDLSIIFVFLVHDFLRNCFLLFFFFKFFMNILGLFHNFFKNCTKIFKTCPLPVSHLIIEYSWIAHNFSMTCWILVYNLLITSQLLLNPICHGEGGRICPPLPILLITVFFTWKHHYYYLTLIFTGLHKFWQKRNLKLFWGTPSYGPLKILNITN